MKIVIIGGGASGIISSIRLKQLIPNSEVIILERLEKIGKKILATGNGKCNFTNINVDNKKYNNPKFVKPTLDIYNSEKLIKYLEELGLYSKELTEGRIYPYTEQAATFLEVLRMNLNKYQIKVESNFEVAKIEKKKDEFIIHHKSKRAFSINADIVILATGGKSAEILGSNGSGYNLAKNLKIKTTDVKAGLVGLIGDSNQLKSLNGLRYKCNVSLFDKKEKQVKWCEYGEVQFKNDGISGIVVMELSSFAANYKGNYLVQLDLIKEKTLNEVKEMLLKRQTDFGDCEIFNYLTGILPKALAQSILKKANIDLSIYIKDLNTRSINKIAALIKQYPIEIKGDYGFDKSQITIGGVELNEINPLTMEAKKVENLYIIGELLNINGRCGGYNLHWALASGLIAAEAIKERMDNNVRNKKS